jgi:hypothetical protein
MGIISFLKRIFKNRGKSKSSDKTLKITKIRREINRKYTINYKSYGFSVGMEAKIIGDPQDALKDMRKRMDKINQKEKSKVQKEILEDRNKLKLK